MLQIWINRCAYTVSVYGQDLERLDIFGDSIFHFLGVIVLLVSYSHPL